MKSELSPKQMLWAGLLLCAPLPLFLLLGFDLVVSIGLALVSLLVSLLAVTAHELRRPAGFRPKRYLSKLTVALIVSVAFILAYSTLADSGLERFKEGVNSFFQGEPD
jgi:hypothetical protein